MRYLTRIHCGQILSLFQVGSSVPIPYHYVTNGIVPPRPPHRLRMPTHEHSLIGPVFERTKPRSSPAQPFTDTPETGFPAAQHRSKSAFARAREVADSKWDVAGSKHSNPPFPVSGKLKKSIPSPAVPAKPATDTKPIPTNTNALLHQIHEKNIRIVAQMSDEEIEREKRAILEQLGEGTEQLLKRVQEARRRKGAKENKVEAQADLEEQVSQDSLGKVNINDSSQATDDSRNHKHIPLVASPTPRRVSDGLATKPGILRVKSLEDMGRSVSQLSPAPSRTRPSSRTGRKLRFAEITPDDVHVYESAPVSPKRTLLALPPPPEAKDDSIISLGTFHKDAVPAKRPRSPDMLTEVLSNLQKADDEPEEGTPEYIRRQYFPGVPANDPAVAWMEASSEDVADPCLPRFDLHGSSIPASVAISLPSHLGLHHHAEGNRAGYTIDDIFLLARSTVPAQRASMLGILARIAHRLGRQVRHTVDQDESIIFAGREGELRKRILATGLAAIDHVGSLGARAVEVVWECLVEWDHVTIDIEGIELDVAPDVVSSLQLDYLLPQVANMLSHAALPYESLVQLLDVLHWLAQQSNPLADMIVSTPRLVQTILRTFILTPIPPLENPVLPNPFALQLLITLASASRSNASALLDPADALLRFLTLLPPSSPYPPDLSITLLTYSLKFYTVLASYGLYSHIATGASQIFTNLASYILSGLPSQKNAIMSDSASKQLRIDWISLLEVWTVCATDPHATNPPHDIFWSQLCAWGWATDVRKLRVELGNEPSNWHLHTAIWESEAAWLEGARINGIKAGDEEREKALHELREIFLFNDGMGFRIVRLALEALRDGLPEGSPTATQDGARVLRPLEDAGNLLTSTLRLWLACLPPIGNGAQLSTPPFALPLSELSALSAMLVKSPIWSLPLMLGAPHVRAHLRPLTRFLSYFHRVSRHIPGTTPQLWFTQALMFLSRLLPGDEYYAFAMLDAFLLVTPQFIGVDPVGLPRGIHMDVLRPFFEYAVRAHTEVYVAPLRPSTESISRSSTLRLPLVSPHSPSSTSNTFIAGLPLSRDFLFTPLTHLLRSGTSPVFRDLPINWSVGEVDIVRATLLLAYAVRKVLIAHGLNGFVHSPAEVVFACMRVCMLEHGVGVGTGGGDVEVFRDAGVEQLMAWLLEPFTARGGAHATLPAAQAAARTLEDASQPYLGATPFYQFYTDLVALYGAVSFGHQTFAALVVAPLAMQYAVDYRRVLWCGGDGAQSGADPKLAGGGAGLGDIVRSVRLPIEEVICTAGDGVDPREYLYPSERDAGILGAYVAALVSRDGGKVEGVLRLVAIHHVACAVWGDLDEGTGEDEIKAIGAEADAEGETKRREEMRGRLLKMVLVHGEPDVIKDVILYRQRQRLQGAFVWPPACYQGDEDEDGKDAAGWYEERIAFVSRAMGEA